MDLSRSPVWSGALGFDVLLSLSVAGFGGWSLSMSSVEVGYDLVSDAATAFGLSVVAGTLLIGVEAWIWDEARRLCPVDRFVSFDNETRRL